jgi:hypothetical protein
MKSFLKYGLITVFTLTYGLNKGFSQDSIPASKKVIIAYGLLIENPASNQAQLGYIRAFPADKAIFMTVFQPKHFGQLYHNSHEYITAFLNLAKYHPQLIIDKSVSIGKDLIWEADATGDIQNGIMTLSVTYPDLFIKKLKTLTRVQQKNLITFLADVENHPAYPHYQQLIDILNKKRETRLATRFIDARTVREKEKE